MSLREIKARMKRYGKILSGKSYFHRKQGLGKVFLPGELKGYFNDLTAKVDWKGEVDDSGIPIVQTNKGRRIYFPITIIQMALGHHDLWLLEGEIEHRQRFLFLANWLLETQDQAGGWITWRGIY